VQFLRAFGLVVSLALTAFIIAVVGPVAADSDVATATRADQAFAKYGGFARHPAVRLADGWHDERASAGDVG